MRTFHDDGLNMWYDDGIPPAEEWQNEIAQKIMGSAMLVVFLSPNAVSSSYVNREIQFALSENKPILPIFLEETSLPPGLKLCLQQYQSCFCQRLDWQKRATEVIRKVLDEAGDPAHANKKVRNETVEEEIFDECEALWKVMDQIFTTQLNRQTRLFGPKKSSVAPTENREEASSPSVFSPANEKPAQPPVQKTRHPFAVDVSVGDGDDSSQEHKPPHKDSYLGNLSWIPPGKITIKVPYSSGRKAVSVPHGFWLSQLVVTQEVYTEVMGTNPSFVDTGGGFEVVNLPVNRVSWLDAVEFCKALTVLSELNGTIPKNHEFRLPTEVEWEYACRAGTTSDYYFGDDPSKLDSYAWFLENAKKTTNPVAQKEPNAWGLYDMYGNVWEWVNDIDAEGEDGYSADPRVDPTGQKEGESRRKRGGSWWKTPDYLRSATRGGQHPESREDDLGFRLLLEVPVQ